MFTKNDSARHVDPFLNIYVLSVLGNNLTFRFIWKLNLVHEHFFNNVLLVHTIHGFSSQAEFHCCFPKLFCYIVISDIFALISQQYGGTPPTQVITGLANPNKL